MINVFCSDFSEISIPIPSPQTSSRYCWNNNNNNNNRNNNNNNNNNNNIETIDNQLNGHKSAPNDSDHLDLDLRQQWEYL